MMTFDEEKIQKQYELYKQAKKAKASEEKVLAEEKLQSKVVWEELKKPQFVVTRKECSCAGCGVVIPAGTKVVVRSELTNVSNHHFTLAFRSKHYCGKCRSVEA